MVGASLRAWKSMMEAPTIDGTPCMFLETEEELRTTNLEPSPIQVDEGLISSTQKILKVSKQKPRNLSVVTSSSPLYMLVLF